MPEEGHGCSGREELMSSKEILDIAHAFVALGVNKIRLTGGEPLVRRDIPEILHGLAQLPVELAITTNGLLVDKYIPLFKETGLKAVNLSMDSLDPVRFHNITKRDDFDRVHKNLLTLIQEDFEVKLNMVVMRGVNDMEVPDFVGLSRSLPLHVRFIEFMPFNGNRWEWGKGVSQEEMLAQTALRFGLENIERLMDKPNDTARNYRIKDFEGTFAIIASVSNPFCDTCNRLRVTADGKMKNCLFSGEETDILSALRQGSDIAPLIRHSVMHKKAVRAGMNTFDQLADANRHNDNRSMVAIGG
jgi:cyclic pyranopterin phosphate synthase